MTPAGFRTYVVLEQADLATLVGRYAEEAGVELPGELAAALMGAEVFHRVNATVARNVEQALRATSKAVYAHLQLTPPLAAVSETYFRPTRCRVTQDTKVSVG